MRLKNKEEKRTAIQLEELVKRGDINHLPEGKVWVENPGLHLTSLYFMQEMRRHKKPELTEEMKELQEEILSNFQRGTYIAAVQEGNKIPLLKQQDGTSFQPIFTDVIEFQKFNREQKFKSAVIKADKLLNILVPEAKGVVINPFGVNLQLPIKRKNNDCFYFSGTGNTLWAAKKIANRFLGECHGIMEYAADKAIQIEDDRIGFVFPVYMNDLPWVVKAFLLELSFKNPKYIFASVYIKQWKNGKAAKNLEKVLQMKHTKLSAVFDLPMPGNCIPGKKQRDGKA